MGLADRMTKSGRDSIAQIGRFCCLIETEITRHTCKVSHTKSNAF